MKIETPIKAAVAYAFALVVATVGLANEVGADSNRAGADPSHPAPVPPKAAGEWNEFDILQKQLSNRKNWDLPRLQREAFRPEAMLWATDANPVDVVLRRTRALLADLQRKGSAQDLHVEAAALEALGPAVERLRGEGFAHEEENRRIFDQIIAVRRKIAFKNPLLDFDKIVFLKHNKQVRGYIHMVDQYLGFNQERAGGVFVLETPFGDHPQVKDLLADSKVARGRLEGRLLTDKGSFISLELDYDGKTLLFAFSEAESGVPPGASFSNQLVTAAELSLDKVSKHYYYRPESAFHVFKVDADGKNLLQLTDSKDHDFDPCFLPNGRIVFISERSGGNERCGGGRPLPTATLNAMMPDGSDVIQLSWHDTNEWQPSVDNNGMIVYTRWDYVDRDSDVAHHLWLCYPDGRDPRSYGGNYPDRRESRPWMEMSLRAIPGSHKYIGTAAGHHGNAYGSLIMKDLREKDDRQMSQIRRITPDVQLPESESAPGVPLPQGSASGVMAFGTPWPLSEDYYLCVYSPEGRKHGIYLVDSFGNRELLYRDPAIACLDPIPFRPRPRPPVIPSATTQAKADRENAQTPDQAGLAMGTVAVVNVYESEFPMPEGTKIKELRVVNLFPKDNTFLDKPHIGVGAQSLARGVLGTAPVEEDGSVYFKMPTGAGVYFQLLDDKGVAVQTMRSDTYLHPGERMTCIGCHEDKHKSLNTPPGQVAKAWRRAPSTLQPEAEGSYPLLFPRLVQPVLNAKCVQCHDEKAPKHSLRGDRFAKDGHSEAFATLSKYAWGMSGGNGVVITRKERQYSVPGQVGAQASKLYPLLLAGHYDVKLTAGEMRRITLWLDCNSNFYGAYGETDRQAKGEIVAPKWGIPAWTPFETLRR